MAEQTSRQWKRRAEVIIGKGGNGLSVTDLRIVFEVTKTLKESPNTANIKIYNLNPGNEQKIKNEFTDVILNCGYEDGMRMVFRGNIKHVYRYRDGNDYITEIEAADGDRDFTTSVINETLAAGTTNKQIISRAVASFKGGTTEGYTGDVNEKPRLRGKVISGMSRDVLSDIARDSGANWSIQDGQLTIVKSGGLLPGTAVLINANTGMLGAPEVDDKGITVKCLLNPIITVNGAIKIDNNSIKAKHEKDSKKKKKKSDTEDDQEEVDSGDGEPVRLSPDGIYKCVKITHAGDTRGSDWTTESLCVAL